MVRLCPQARFISPCDMDFILPRIYREISWGATESSCKVRRLKSSLDVAADTDVLGGYF
jgi:hypothetical protein